MIPRGNRRTAVIAAIVCLVLIVAIAVLSEDPSRHSLVKQPSTFFTDSGGARGIYLVLQRVLPSAEQWRIPLTELNDPSRPKVTTLIAMNPNPFGQAEAKALEQWISSGGQLILAMNSDWAVQKRPGDSSTKD